MPRKEMVRGAYVLPHQSQALRRDLDGENIRKHAGNTAHAYRLDELQIETGRWAPYQYLVSQPGSASMAWTAFRNADELKIFCEAYNLGIDHVPEPGSPFSILLPATDTDWQPLTDQEE